MPALPPSTGDCAEAPILADVSPSSDRPPSVDRLARSLTDSGLPHPLRVEVARAAIAEGDHEHAEARARRRRRQFLQPVINGTGVLLHTNLGRAPVAHTHTATYSNLELDLRTGKRGSRQKAVGDLIAAASGAEAAVVVNNCAGAVLLALAALATGKGVAVSRGELVEIGGGFRIPDVMVQSGARLVEVGTTNRTRLADYQRVVANGDVEVVMHVHRSNYRIEGFTESVPINSLAGLDVPVVADLGSGLLDTACPWLDGPPPSWLNGEPGVRQVLAGGTDLVLFSGDKLLGGPQAGIIAGRQDLVDRCAGHPLARALRPGSLVLEALQNVLLAYLDRRGADIPFWRMATTTLDELERRSRYLEGVSGAKAVRLESVPGGGTMPGVVIPSWGLRLPGDCVGELRDRERPLIARTDGDTTVIDLRTIDPDDDSEVARALAALADGEAP